VLSTAAINAARFDYNPSTLAPLGLLIEQSSTNLILNSGAIGGTSWTLSGATATLNAVNGPDGNQVMTKLSETATTTNHRVSFSTAVTTTTYAYSMYAKAAERNNIMMLMVAGAGYITQNFNLSTGTVQSSGSFGATITAGTPIITYVGNGIYRCTMIGIVAVAVSVLYGCDVAQDNTTSTNYAGTAGYGIYIWGAQLEALAFATSYIPTTSAQATRAADNATMTGTNFSSWFSQAQGSFFMDFDIGYYVAGSGGYNQGLACFGTSGNRILSFVGNSSNRPITAQLYDGVTLTNVTLNQSNNLTINTLIKVGFSYNTTTITGAYNGLTPNSSTGGTLSLNTSILYLGNRFDSSTYLNGHIRKFTFYQSTFTAAQLQALTT
jgi:hypothetical protein